MATQLVAATVLLTCLLVGSVLAAPKSAGFLTSPCSFKDPALNDCMLTQAKAILPRIASGVKEWGLVPIDPLFVTKVELHNSGNQAVNLEMGGYNLTFKGYATMDIQSLKFDPKSLHLEMSFKIPLFSGTGRYKTNGKIILLPINGEGDVEFSNEGQRTTVTMDFKRVEKGGKVYLKLDKLYFDLEHVDKLKSHFDNLFNNKQLSDNMNKILNDSNQAVFKELRPSVNAAFSELITVLFGPMFDRVPLNELFTDTE